ncbi:hypothetical protein ACFSHQ_25195 [Gemmobacter lanyuensis]
MAVNGQRAEIGFKKGGYIFIVPPSAIDMLKANYDTELSMGCNVVWLTPDEIKHKFPRCMWAIWAQRYIRPMMAGLIPMPC